MEAIVDVVVVAKNEQNHIRRCIESIFAQVGLGDDSLLINLIVVDNGSVDETANIASSLTKNVILAPNATLGEMRNLGAAYGNAEYIAYIDADCEAPKTWLSSAIEKISNGTCDAVGGPCLLPANATLVEAAWTPYSRRTGDQYVSHLATSSFIVKRLTFSKVGAFDSRIGAGEDTDFSRRLVAHGYRLMSSECCAVIHHGYPKYLLDFFLREYWHGYWAAANKGSKNKIGWIAIGYIAAVTLLISAGVDGIVNVWLVMLGIFLLPGWFAQRRMRTPLRNVLTIRNMMSMILYILYFGARGGAFFMWRLGMLKPKGWKRMR